MESKLLNEEALEWSTIVANNRMNRERGAIGINSYEKEIKINPVNFIKERVNQNDIQWTDLCCGRGKALIQVSDHFKKKPLAKKLMLTGIDLVDYFEEHEATDNLFLKKMNLTRWKPQHKNDLVTVVHGLHYIGDKLALIIKSILSLKENGLFIGNLDLNNIEIEGSKKSKSLLLDFFKQNKIDYNQRTKIISATWVNEITHNFQYLGADDKAGPNYTGQEAVKSIYCLKSQ